MRPEFNSRQLHASARCETRVNFRLTGQTSFLPLDKGQVVEVERFAVRPLVQAAPSTLPLVRVTHRQPPLPTSVGEDQWRAAWVKLPR